MKSYREAGQVRPLGSLLLILSLAAAVPATPAALPKPEEKHR